jgi:hypothetical protein
MFVSMMYCYRFYSLLVETVYMLNTFTNHDSLIDKNETVEPVTIHHTYKHNSHSYQ